MSVAAIIMLTIAIVTVWGGLTVALLNLSRHPEEDGAAPEGTAPASQVH